MIGLDGASAPGWLWQPITIGAALFQTARNASQRTLTDDIGPLGATYVRFLFGMPVAILWFVLVGGGGQGGIAAPGTFLAWCVFGGVIQIIGNACLLLTMKQRNFMLGVAYSKTEAIQAAAFGVIFLGELIPLGAVVAIVMATVGVMLISFAPAGTSLPGVVAPWRSRGAALGLMCGACFGVAAVAYRGAALAQGDDPFVAAAYVLLVVMFVQTLILSVYIWRRRPDIFPAMMRRWRLAATSGTMGGLASLCWFTAMALHPVADVRALGLTEMIFSYLASQRLFRDRIRFAEFVGIAMIGAGAFGLIYLR